MRSEACLKNWFPSGKETSRTREKEDQKVQIRLSGRTRIVEAWIAGWLNYSYLIVSVFCEEQNQGVCSEIMRWGSWELVETGEGLDQPLQRVRVQVDQRHPKDGPVFKVNSHEYMMVNPPCCVLLQLLTYRKRESVEWISLGLEVSQKEHDQSPNGQEVWGTGNRAAEIMAMTSKWGRYRQEGRRGKTENKGTGGHNEIKNDLRGFL